MSETNLRAKRRRIEKNTFLDLEAVVGEEESSDEDDLEEFGGFIVDDTTDLQDVLGNHAFMPENLQEQENLDGEYELFLRRAKARAQETLPNRHPNTEQWVLNRVLGRSTDHEQGELTWVRIRRIHGKLGVYVGDVALAIATAQPDSYQFWLIPWPALMKEGKGVRPSQILFDAELAAAEYGPHSVTHKQEKYVRFSFRGNDYSTNGFLVLCGHPSLAASFGGQVIPNACEFNVFLKCKAVDQSFQLMTKRRMANNTLQTGDRVKCIGGELQGLTGLIQDLSDSEETVTIFIASLDIIETVLQCEVRKEFKLGDRVVVSTPGSPVERGWIVDISENDLCVMDVKRGIEMRCTRIQLRFDDVVQHLVDLRNTSPLSFEDRRAMKDNPNKKFIGKQVMITGAHQRKGITGIVKDVTLDGHALVSLHVYNTPAPEKLAFKFLRLFVNSGLIQMGLGSSYQDINPVPYHAPIGTSHTPMPIAVTPSGEAWDPASRTPDSSAIPCTPLDAAWDPSSRTPESNASTCTSIRSEVLGAWINEPQMVGIRFQLKVPGLSILKVYELKGISNSIVKVRDGVHSKNFAIDKVNICTPTRPADVVVSFGQGEYFGQLFRIKTFDPQNCVLRKYGVKRTTRIENLYTLPTAMLAVVYPPTK